MKNIEVKELKSLIELDSFRLIKHMWSLSNQNKFTKWGLIKHLIISTINKKWKVFIAVEAKNGKPQHLIGFSLTKKNFLYRIVINKRYRGFGIGKKLMPLFVNTTETNREKVVNFYKKMGYRVVGKKNDSYVLKK